MRANIIATCALLVFVGLLAPEAAAQRPESPDRAGTAAADFLLLPTTARSAALGTGLTSSLPGMAGVEALTANPAALTVNPSTNALFSRMEYVADIGVNHFGVAQRFGANQIALTITSWDFGDITQTDANSPDPGVAEYTANNTVVGATFARQFTDRISAGVTAKAISQTIDDMDANTIAFDAGMTYLVGESGLRFGVSLKNFGPQVEFDGAGLDQPITVGDEATDTVAGQIKSSTDELPSQLNFGAAYTRQFAGDLSVTALANFESNSYREDYYSGGLELGYQNLFFVRGGLQLQSDMDQTFYEGWNVGAGLNLDLGGTAVMVDYAYRGTEFFDGVNLFTVGLTL